MAADGGVEAGDGSVCTEHLADGGFWTTFSSTNGGVEVSQLQLLLQQPDCSVEALLDEDDVIQELRGGNEALLRRLRRSDAIALLLEYITREPPAGSSPSRCFRCPFVAVELLTCPGASDILLREFYMCESLWSFLDSTAPADVNPVLAGYYARTVAAVLSVGQWERAEIVEVLRERNAMGSLLRRFLERLHLRSLAGLFARLLCADRPALMPFPVEGLAELLVDCLASTQELSVAREAQENVALITLELLAQRDTIYYGDEFLRQLTEPGVIGSLVDHCFEGSPGASGAAASILNSLVFHVYVAPKGAGASMSTPTLSPLSAPSHKREVDVGDCVGSGGAGTGAGPDGDLSVADCLASSLEGVPEMGGAGGAGAAVDAGAGGPAPVTPPGTPGRLCGEGDSSPAWLMARGKALMRQLCSHLPRLRAVLESAVRRSPEPAGTSCGSRVRGSLGSVVLDVISLLTMMVRTGSRTLLDTVRQENLLPLCAELFFRHPWSSLLHNAFRALIEEVLASSDGGHAELLMVLLAADAGGLAPRLVAEYAAEAAETGPLRLRRAGYMGHVYCLCCDLREYGERVPEVGALLEAVPGWTSLLLEAVDATTRVLSEEIGGPIGDGRGADVAAAALEAPPAAPPQRSAEELQGDPEAEIDLDAGCMSRAYDFDDGERPASLDVHGDRGVPLDRERPTAPSPTEAWKDVDSFDFDDEVAGINGGSAAAAGGATTFVAAQPPWPPPPPGAGTSDTVEAIAAISREVVVEDLSAQQHRLAKASDAPAPTSAFQPPAQPPPPPPPEAGGVVRRRPTGIEELLAVPVASEFWTSSPITEADEANAQLPDDPAAVAASVREGSGTRGGRALSGGYLLAGAAVLPAPLAQAGVSADTSVTAPELPGDDMSLELPSDPPPPPVDAVQAPPPLETWPPDAQGAKVECSNVDAPLPPQEHGECTSGSAG
eukprot:TRINITY_DN710_c0_g2_i3.p1 TRINITY_DN710_c0_g2~~TRINITY_DN710_c0_g2_i3.p1  ORF type:complete len:949 (+),score=238.96 TRINITY_DN710_c0_g2_i3:78-2924(+)